MRAHNQPLTAESYAYHEFLRDIEDLSAEELEAIPSFLLIPWQIEQEKNLPGGPVTSEG
jgi:hypothetical protein